MGGDVNRAIDTVCATGRSCLDSYLKRRRTNCPFLTIAGVWGAIHGLSEDQSRADRSFSSNCQSVRIGYCWRAVHIRDRNGGISDATHRHVRGDRAVNARIKGACRAVESGELIVAGVEFSPRVGDERSGTHVNLGRVRLSVARGPNDIIGCKRCAGRRCVGQIRQRHLSGNCCRRSIGGK